MFVCLFVCVVFTWSPPRSNFLFTFTDYVTSMNGRIWGVWGCPPPDTVTLRQRGNIQSVNIHILECTPWCLTLMTDLLSPLLRSNWSTQLNWHPYFLTLHLYSLPCSVSSGSATHTSVLLEADKSEYRSVIRNIWAPSQFGIWFILSPHCLRTIAFNISSLLFQIHLKYSIPTRA